MPKTNLKLNAAFGIESKIASSSFGARSGSLKGGVEREEVSVGGVGSPLGMASMPKTSSFPNGNTSMKGKDSSSIGSSVAGPGGFGAGNESGMSFQQQVKGGSDTLRINASGRGVGAMGAGAMGGRGGISMGAGPVSGGRGLVMNKDNMGPPSVGAMGRGSIGTQGMQGGGASPGRGGPTMGAGAEAMAGGSIGGRGGASQGRVGPWMDMQQGGSFGGPNTTLKGSVDRKQSGGFGASNGFGGGTSSNQFGSASIDSKMLGAFDRPGSRYPTQNMSSFRESGSSGYSEENMTSYQQSMQSLRDMPSFREGETPSPSPLLGNPDEASNQTGESPDSMRKFRSG